MAAAGKWKVFNQAKLWLADFTIDLDDTTNWKMALFLNTGTPVLGTGTTGLDIATPNFAAITNTESSNSGYTAGGQACTGITWTKSTTTSTWTMANRVWTAGGGASLSARYALIYKDATVNTVVKPCLCFCVLDTAPADVVATDGNTLTVAINASGVFTLTGGDTD